MVSLLVAKVKAKDLASKISSNLSHFFPLTHPHPFIMVVTTTRDQRATIHALVVGLEQAVQALVLAAITTITTAIILRIMPVRTAVVVTRWLRLVEPISRKAMGAWAMEEMLGTCHKEEKTIN